MPETGRLLLFWDPLCGGWNSKYTCQVIWDQTPPSERRRAEAPWAAASPAYIRFVYEEVEGSFIRKTEDLDGSDALMPACGLNPVIRWVIPEAEMRLRKFGRGSWQDSGALYDCFDAHVDNAALDFDLTGHQFLGAPTPVQHGLIREALCEALGVSAASNAANNARIDAAVKSGHLFFLFQLKLEHITKSNREGCVTFYTPRQQAGCGVFDGVIAVHQQT